MREEIDELTQMLKGNLEKVVQHGKRADSIVKNMLLHSREGSGEHRPRRPQRVVEESLNLAYHGARAEKPRLQHHLAANFDPDAGEVEMFPQEITRVLLNLISNGFYAAAKRRRKAASADFEPTFSRRHPESGRQVEIRDSRQRHRYSRRGEGKRCSIRSSRPSRRAKAPGSAFR